MNSKLPAQKRSKNFQQDVFRERKTLLNDAVDVCILPESIHYSMRNKEEFLPQDKQVYRCEFKFQKSQDKYEALYENGPIAFLTISDDGVIRDCNHAMVELLFVEKSDLLGTNLKHYILEDSYSVFELYLSRLVAGKSKATGEINLKSGKESRTVRIESVTFKESESHNLAICMALIDITEQVYLKRELYTMNQELEHRVRLRTIQYENSRYEIDAILNAAPDCILTIDSDGIVEHVNRAIESRLGYSMKEISGCNIRALIPHDEAPRNEQVFNKIKNFEVASDFSYSTSEIKLKDKKGRLIPFSLFISRIDHSNKFTLVLHDLRDIKRLRREVLQATEQERSRISQELHDSVGQDMAGMSMLARSISSEIAVASDSCRTQFLEFSRTLDKCIQQLRGIIFALAPLEMNDGGLVDALQKLARAVETSTGLACRVHIIGENFEKNVERDIQILRIAQEAVHNVVKHANASNIDIVIECGEEFIALTVSDDGIGTNSYTSTDLIGQGITIMRYRANTLGGRLIIKENVPRGLQVFCWVPKNAM